MTKINKAEWDKQSILDIKAELLAASKGAEKAQWEKRVVNSSYPCIAVSSTYIDSLAKQISRGDYVAFLELWQADNYSELVLQGKVISRIKDKDIFVKYLNDYLDLADSWGATDILRYPIKGNEEYFWRLSGEYIKSPKTYIRRCGLLIMMKGYINQQYIDQVLARIDSMSGETEYYVQMMLAWILSECLVKQYAKTIKYYQNNNQSAWVINKSISKCRDSYRVSAEDKAKLLKYKK